jgi:3-vinyl bacteriochlorophyllide hydratase
LIEDGYPRMGVIALHTYYLYALLTDAIDTRQQMCVALAAYVIYVVNAIQFVLKLRAARMGAAALDAAARESGALGSGIGAGAA